MDTMTNGHDDQDMATGANVFAKIIANQEKILANQAKIAGNQKRLEQILANQKATIANQKAIQGNQKKLDQVLANQAKRRPTGIEQDAIRIRTESR